MTTTNNNNNPRGLPILSYLDGSDRCVLDAVHRPLSPSSSSRFPDTKDFVDMPIVVAVGDEDEASPEAVKGRLRRATGASEVDEILRECFGAPGLDLETCAPDDWTGDLRNEEILAGAGSSEAARDFVAHVHSCWGLLCKRRVADAKFGPDRHTIIETPHKLFVPGSRFREQYYWDSYFVMHGLLVSRMPSSAFQIVENLLHCVERFGYVPNGTRSYYIGRSQPPLLSEMVVDLWSWSRQLEPLAGRAAALLHRALPLLVMEHAFLTGAERTIALRKDGVSHELVRYRAETECPRPESYKEDVRTLSQALSRLGEEESAQEFAAESPRAKAIYREIATMAESGWDFSSRWLEDPRGFDLATARITRTIPADLNTIVARMESNVAAIAGTCGKADISRKYRDLSEKRFQAVDALLWDGETRQWRDLVLSDDGGGEIGPGDPEGERERACAFGSVNVASNWLPLWRPRTEDEACTDRASAAIASLEASGLIQPGGLATSMRRTGHQWDFPNAWAPLQYLMHQALVATETEKGLILSEQIAKRFVANARQAWARTGQMHEKYDAERPGRCGGGGEYVPQTGFGWTNGVVLKLLALYDDFPDF